MSKINIYQIFHKTELKSLLDPDFIPLDHCDYTQNNPEESNKWREWPILKKIGYDLAKADDADIWGFVSYKFNEKTNCSGKDFINFIKNKPIGETLELTSYGLGSLFLLGAVPTEYKESFFKSVIFNFSAKL